MNLRGHESIAQLGHIVLLRFQQTQLDLKSAGAGRVKQLVKQLVKPVVKLVDNRPTVDGTVLALQAAVDNSAAFTWKI